MPLGWHRCEMLIAAYGFFFAPICFVICEMHVLLVTATGWTCPSLVQSLFFARDGRGCVAPKTHGRGFTHMLQDGLRD